ncbi:hypothetical protein ABPG77_011314 [Micractinium sp. CCAP 211/92]
MDAETDSVATRQQRSASATEAVPAGGNAGSISSNSRSRAPRDSIRSSSGAGGEGSHLHPSTESSDALEAGQLSGRPPPRYSTHTCIGEKFYDNWHSATCKFDSMCLNASTLEWEYYVDPELPDIPITYNQDGVAMSEFSPHLVNVGHAHLDITEGAGWRPVVVRQRVPGEGPGVVWAPSPQALLHAVPAGLTTNFGHVLYDVLVPLFNMQHRFGVYTPDAQPLILRATNGSEAELRKRLPRLINTRRPEMSLLRLAWRNDDEWAGEYAARLLGAAPGSQPRGLVCFQTVLAGTGSLSRQMAPVDALPFRQAVVHHIGLQEPPQERPVVTILNKQGRRMIENSREVLAYLAARCPQARVHMFDFGKHPDMTMPEQVKLMSDTSILVTPCGGLATVLAFMRPGATAIAMNYWHTLHNRSMQLENNYYQHIEYLDLQYFPVTPQDYENTTDRPACENVEGGGRPQDAHYPLIGALVHCNLRLGPVALQRLGHFVDQAMRRWAARTGRYEVLQQGPPAALEAAGANEPAPQAWHATPPAAPRRGAGRRRHSGTGSTPGGAVEQAARRW